MDWIGRKYIPLASPFPLQTFCHRSLLKISLLAKNIVKGFGNILRLSGSRVIGVRENSNVLLRLNFDSAAGKKGLVIEVPRDKTIFQAIKQDGAYEIDDARFLSIGLVDACAKPNAKVVLLDIGANVGIMTLQALNLSHAKAQAICFEPIPQHAAALRNNLSHFEGITVNDFALSDGDASSVIFTETANRGNSSIFKSVIPHQDYIETKIKLVDTSKYFEMIQSEFSGYVIKSDTQGMDAMILARIPSLIWEKTGTAIIEVWALKEIDANDVDALLGKLSHFNSKCWSQNVDLEIDFAEIRSFWLGQSGTWKNLYLSKFDSSNA